ncbi:MAG TPA: hypothetical protein VMW83_14635 [Spirochaetia bacterium]|nr:hypothetical protein [Spirochaetia bacterium]
MSILQTLHRVKGVTLVIVTHEPDIAAYCEREVIMRDGRIVNDRNRRNAEQRRVV